MINKYIPEVLIEDRDYKVLVDIINEVNSDIKSLIDVYPEIVDIDNCEVLFLPKLTELLNYKFKYNVDNLVKRELLKKIIDIYRDRGTDDSIIMAATYGDDKLWIGSHVFLPGDLELKNKATIVNPSGLLFRHDISRFSGTHRYPDGFKWRSGVIIIKVSRINDEIKQAILNVIPAGLKAYIEIDYNVAGQDIDLVSFENWFALSLWYDLEYYLRVSDKISGLQYDISIHNKYPYSGRQQLFNINEIDYLMASRSYSDDYTRVDNLSVSSDQSINGVEQESISAIRLVQIDEIVPTDTWYPMTAILNLHVDDYLENYCTSVDVVTKEPIHNYEKVNDNYEYNVVMMDNFSAISDTN